jgi:hypothetical protein
MMKIDASYVDQWIELVTTNHNIKVLALDFYKVTTRIKKYSLPDATNVAASLAFLMLRNCELRRPLFCYFLKDLSLTSVSVCGNHIDQNLTLKLPFASEFFISWIVRGLTSFELLIILVLKRQPKGVS